MSRADYAHWNEEADIMWWQEEGRFSSEENRDSAYDPDDYLSSSDSPSMGAADAFAEELGEMDDVDLWDLSQDAAYLARWPKAKPLIEWELRHRGMIPTGSEPPSV